MKMLRTFFYKSDNKIVKNDNLQALKKIISILNPITYIDIGTWEKTKKVSNKPENDSDTNGSKKKKENIFYIKSQGFKEFSLKKREKESTYTDKENNYKTP